MARDERDATRAARPRPSGRVAAAVAALAVAAALVAVACASDDDGAGPSPADRSTSTTTAAAPKDRPAGPAARIGDPLEGGEGINVATAEPPGPALEEAGYLESEHPASGTATSYVARGEIPTDGRFSVAPDAEADYTTRIIVRRPAQAADFNGTVVVEWLNVSSGLDAAPDYAYLQEELLREGYAWVGVSAQRIGIEGGPIAVQAPGAAAAGAGTGLRTLDPERYGDLRHPGDEFSYDIYTQVARALREPGDDGVLGGLPVRHLLATGESQSAFTLTTYYDAVQPLTDAFDGFFIHSRGGVSTPLGTPSRYIDLASSLAGPPVELRTDLAVPAIVIETETDLLSVLNYLPSRQPDHEHLRVWELAGTAHADAFQVGANEEGLGCATPINRGQQVFVLRAALRALRDWVTEGTAPPHGEPLEVDPSGTQPAFVLDELGIVRGGVRNPAVDAPVQVLSGFAPGTPSVLCMLLGSTTPIPDDVLAARYDDADDYLARYEEATDAAIDAGFILADDRDAVLDDADPSLVPG